MRDLGFTPEGNNIVEMKREEYEEFMRLHSAIEGHGFPSAAPMNHLAFRQDFDLTHTFGVIRAYYYNWFYVNQMQEFLDDMKASLNDKKKENGQ